MLLFVLFLLLLLFISDTSSQPPGLTLSLLSVCIGGTFGGSAQWSPTWSHQCSSLSASLLSLSLFDCLLQLSHVVLHHGLCAHSDCSICPICLLKPQRLSRLPTRTASPRSQASILSIWEWCCSWRRSCQSLLAAAELPAPVQVPMWTLVPLLALFIQQRLLATVFPISSGAGGRGCLGNIETVEARVPAVLPDLSICSFPHVH